MLNLIILIILIAMSNHVDGKDKTIPAPAVNLSIKTRAHISQTYKTNDTMTLNCDLMGCDVL